MKIGVLEHFEKNALRAANSGIGMRVGLGRILGCKLGGLNSGWNEVAI